MQNVIRGKKAFVVSKVNAVIHGNTLNIQICLAISYKAKWNVQLYVIIFVKIFFRDGIWDQCHFWIDDAPWEASIIQHRINNDNMEK